MPVVFQFRQLLRVIGLYSERIFFPNLIQFEDKKFCQLTKWFSKILNLQTLVLSLHIGF